MKKIAWLQSIWLSSILSAATTPSALKVKVYEVWFSTSPYCTNPVKVIDNVSNPQYVDMYGASATLGSAKLPASGTYQCVMIVSSDTLKVTPAANDGTYCVAGTEFSADTCQTGAPVFTLPDTTTVTCASNTDNKTPAYFSTASAGNPSGYNGFFPPTASDSSKGYYLVGGALTVTGSSLTKTMYVDCTNKVQDAGSTCSINACAFGFR